MNPQWNANGDFIPQKGAHFWAKKRYTLHFRGLLFFVSVAGHLTRARDPPVPLFRRAFFNWAIQQYESAMDCKRWLHPTTGASLFEPKKGIPYTFGACFFPVAGHLTRGRDPSVPMFRSAFFNWAIWIRNGTQMVTSSHGSVLRFLSKKKVNLLTGWDPQARNFVSVSTAIFTSTIALGLLSTAHLETLIGFARQSMYVFDVLFRVMMTFR